MSGWKPWVVLFDLGGVLFEYRDAGALEQIRGSPFPPSELEEFWLQSRWAMSIATGRCSPIEFASGAIKELELDTSPEQFLPEFSTWLRGCLPGAESLLISVAGQARIACLSNTNEIDAARFRHEFEIQRHFEACFFSNEIGLRKPEREAYAHVLRALGVPASAVLFLDDTTDCVEGARAIGICSERVKGPEEVRAAVEQYLGPQPSLVPATDLM